MSYHGAVCLEQTLISHALNATLNIRGEIGRCDVEGRGSKTVAKHDDRG